MSKAQRISIFLLVCLLSAASAPTVPALAAPADYTITVSADGQDAKPGELVTVRVTVSGAQFCGAQMELSYDAQSMEYVSSMSGWSNDADGRLAFFDVNTSGGYWEDGKVLGTFQFMVKEDAPEGEAVFCIGADSPVYIVGDWAQGASSEPAAPLDADRFVSAAVRIVNDGTASEARNDFGAVGDDGSTLSMEAGHHVYSIPTAQQGHVVWQSSDESVVTVDENGLVTALSDGSAVITATDEAGNALEQRTILVGAAPGAQEETIPPEQPEETLPPEPEETPAAPTPDASESPEPADAPAGTETLRPNARPIWIAAAAAGIVAAAAALVLSKRKKQAR